MNRGIVVSYCCCMCKVRIDYNQFCVVVNFGFYCLVEFDWVSFSGVIVYYYDEVGVFDVDLVVGYCIVIKCWSKICYCWFVLDMCLVVDCEYIQCVGEFLC